MDKDDEFFHKNHTEELVDTVHISLENIMKKVEEGKDRGLIVPINVNIKGMTIKPFGTIKAV
jgi:hypothetical protein